MARILYIVSTLERSGPTGQLYNLIKYLNREQFDPYLVTLSEEPENSRWEEYANCGVNLHSLKLPRLKGALSASKGMLQKIKESRPHIIHSQGIRADVLVARAKQYAARFSTQRNYPYEDYPLKYGALWGRLMAFSHYRSWRGIPFVIACSRTLAQRNSRHGLKTVSVQNGVDSERFGAIVDVNEKMRLRQQRGWKENETVFVSVGDLSRRKDPEIVIRAFKNAKRQNARLLFLGDGPLRGRCEKLVNGNQFIGFAGKVKDVARYLQAADVLVSASHSEGLPNTVLEALATGLPVILSDIPPHKEILDLGQKAGRLFQAGNEVELTSSIKEYVPTPSACGSAREIVESHLSAQRMSERYQELYRMALAGCQHGI